MPIILSTNQIKVNDGNDYLSVGLLKDLKFVNPSGYVTPEIYGAVGDGVADDTQAWKDAIASGQVILATNTYLCSEQLSLNNDVFCVGGGKVINNTSDGFLINSKFSKTYWLNVAASSELSGTTRIGVEIKNSNNCNFRIITTNFHTGVKIHGDGVGCCYNSLETIFTINAKYSVNITAENSGWANENYYYNHRCVCWSNSLYEHNNYGVYLDHGNSNHFYNGCYEGSYCGVTVKHGSYNTFENIRMEACTYNAIFDSGTYSNIVYPSYPGGTATDNGTNAVITISKIISKFSE